MDAEEGIMPLKQSTVKHLKMGLLCKTRFEGIGPPQRCRSTSFGAREGLKNGVSLQK